jgi:phenylpropionate dioxygenase-like ring-hydroxylating dioxygenase large terminal subunit
MYFSKERNARVAAKLFDHIRNNTTDLADDIFEYDLAVYMDPDLAIKEREKIFEALPMMAAHSAQLPEVNSYITVQLNRSNVLLTRQKDGSVGAFLNICRHRGAALVDSAAGKRPLFTCRYHGWTYANDGELKAITFAESFGTTPCGKRGLVSLPVEERNGFIWVVENPEGSIDVETFLGPEMDQALREYNFDKWFFYKDHVFDFPQNWKIMMDGLIDGYHVQFLHGKTINPYFYPNMLGVDVYDPHATWGNPRRAIEKILHEEAGESSLERYVIIGNAIMPNSALVLHPHHVEYWTVYQNPNDLTQCRVHLRYLTPRSEHDERSVEILDKNWEIATSAIINEDVPVGNSIQASSRSPFAGPVVLGRNEIINQLFHRNYRKYMELA